MSIIELKNQPILGQKLYHSYSDALLADNGVIQLEQNIQTGIISNVKFDPSKIIYDENYACDQSNSNQFKEHIFNVLSILNKYFYGLNLIEVGCGKGFFVDELLIRGFSVHGYDTTYNGNSSFITKSYFNINSIIKGDAIILRHVLEHIQNPILFLENLLCFNGNKGLIYIEVPCFDWIIDNKTYFDITYEHVNYFRKDDFSNIFDNILEIGNIFGGQYIYLIADLKSIRSETLVRESKINKIKRIDFPSDFKEGINNSAKFFSPENQNFSFIWGAAGKGAQFTVAIKNYSPEYEVKFAVDLNQEKQNKYLPISGTKVISPDECLKIFPEGSNAIIMNPIYFEEIRNITKNYYNYYFA